MYVLNWVIIVKEKMFAILLFCLEIIIFVSVNSIFRVSFSFIVETGIVWFVLLLAFGHYRIQSTLIWDEMGKLFKIFLYSSLIIFAFSFPNTKEILNTIAIYLIMMILTLLIDRMLRIIFRDLMTRKTLIIGTNNDAYRIAQIAQNNRFALTSVKGFVKVPNEEVDKDILTDELFKLYELEDLYNQIDVLNIEQVIISLSKSDKEILDQISKKLHGKVKYIKIAPKLDFTMTFDSKIDDFDGILLVSTAKGSMNGLEKLIKRCFDIVVGVAGCVVLVPLTFYVKYMNRKNGDTDPVFFTQERIGLHGKTIKIYKFRSMIPNAEAILEEMMKNDPLIKEEYLMNKKLVNDPRITKVGNFLRKTSLDEFPQFINVLKGEMSFVGPRPYLFREKEDMDIYYDSIIQCKPGITGMWQANGRSNVGFIDRCKLDDYYYKNWNMGLDLIIIYKTVKCVIYGKGAL